MSVSPRPCPGWTRWFTGVGAPQHFKWVYNVGLPVGPSTGHDHDTATTMTTRKRHANNNDNDVSTTTTTDTTKMTTVLTTTRHDNDTTTTTTHCPTRANQHSPSLHSPHNNNHSRNNNTHKATTHDGRCLGYRSCIALWLGGGWACQSTSRSAERPCVTTAGPADISKC